MKEQEREPVRVEREERNRGTSKGKEEIRRKIVTIRSGEIRR